MIVHKTGDIFTSEADVLGHGVNTVGAMASGIAPLFRDRYPQMHHWYQDLCKSLPMERLVGGAAVYAVGNEGQPKAIANLFSQDMPGANAKYRWTRMALNDAIVYMKMNGLTGIALPRIGCGIGGLDWQEMVAMIEYEFADIPGITIELWSL